MVYASNPVGLAGQADNRGSSFHHAFVHTPSEVLPHLRLTLTSSFGRRWAQRRRFAVCGEYDVFAAKRGRTVTGALPRSS